MRLRLLYGILVFLALATGSPLFAQSVSMALQPLTQTVEATNAFFSEATITLRVTATQGFVGPVRISGYCSTLTAQGEGVFVSKELVNLPYSQDNDITVKVVLSKASEGIHRVVIRATKMDGTWTEETAEVKLVTLQAPAWRIVPKQGATVLGELTRDLFLDKRQGIIWSADQEGLKKFDGAEWTTIAWPEETAPFAQAIYPRTLALDRDGEVWVLLQLQIYQGYTSFMLLEYTSDGWIVRVDRMSSYTIPDEDKILTVGITHMWFNSNDDLFILDFAALWKYTVADGSMVRQQSMEGAFSSGVLDLYNNLWVENSGGIHSNNGLMRLDNQGNITFWLPPTNSAQELVPGLAVDVCFPAGVDHENNLYMRIHKNGSQQWEVVRLDIDRQQYTRINSGLLSGKNISSITRGENGSLWVPLKGEGLARFDGTEWWHYTTENSELPENDVKSVQIDDNNMAWIETASYLVILDANVPSRTTFREIASSVTGSTPPNLPFSVNLSPNPVISTNPATIRINVPNPAGAAAAAMLSLDASSHLRIRFLNVLGEEVMDIPAQEYAAGTHSIPLNARALLPGMYFLQVIAGGGSYTTPFVVAQ